MTIGLALSGGGALGAGHIGILEELMRHDLTPQFICGSSAGAIISVLFADGGVPAIIGFLNDMQKVGLVNAKPLVPPLPGTVLKEIRKALRANMRAHSFAEMPIKCSCIATDLITGASVVLDSGSPIEAAIASSVLVGVFKPMRMGTRLLVDGALTRNMPVDVLRAFGADFLISSTLYNLPPMPAPHLNRLQQAQRAIQIIQREINRTQIAYCDFNFTPAVQQYHWLAFDKIADITEAGRIYARAHIGELVEAVRQITA